ncbi:unnamed protein product [Caenorhabditis angaria]|uniref:Uncharacterized protein n=1 Tax=Caenorhabditis angaria TaxID=860376 RepID=A0A9P1IWY6_9PELO|nr:unnamed protein product [Caenorhabditis angaria]
MYLDQIATLSTTSTFVTPIVKQREVDYLYLVAFWLVFVVCFVAFVMVFNVCCCITAIRNAASRRRDIHQLPRPGTPMPNRRFIETIM